MVPYEWTFNGVLVLLSIEVNSLFVDDAYACNGINYVALIFVVGIFWIYYYHTSRTDGDDYEF